MRRSLPVSLIVGAWAFSLAVFSRLPDRVPVHWGISGEPDRLGTRFEGAFLIPLLMTAIFVVMQWYPSRDPRATNIAKFRDAYDTIVATVIAFFLGLHVFALGNALGWQVDMTTVAFVGIGLLFIILGNLLPRARSNFIFGIRTPWTLSSDSVWTRSHRLGGYAMVVAGVVTIISAFLARPVGFTIAVASFALSALIPIVYSYIIWSRDHGRPSNGTP